MDRETEQRLRAAKILNEDGIRVVSDSWKWMEELSYLPEESLIKPQPAMDEDAIREKKKNLVKIRKQAVSKRINALAKVDKLAHQLHNALQTLEQLDSGMAEDLDSAVASNLRDGSDTMGNIQKPLPINNPFR